MARCFYHPLGEQTAYTYDLAGRVLTEDHSDRGLTTTTYDKASNVMEISTPATQSFGGSITMNYDFNRLVSRLMPNSSGMDLYDIQYTYGYKGDGRNGAGRVVKVEQGQTFKIDDLRYDELGQSAEEVVSIDVPMQGGRMFTTRKFYDSFGRILQAGYPDGDKVDYQYNALGELSGINSTLGGVTQPIITAISYNGYGQISLLTYGNGTSTTYSYASGNTKKATTLMSSAVTGKEQGGVSPTTLLSRQYAYNKQGMVSTMDRSIAGSLLSQSLVVNYHDSYSYDAFGRLEGHQQLNGTTPQYDLTMSYNKAGGITFKDCNGNGFMNAQSLNYNLEYGYSPAKPHQLEHIWDADNAITTQFQYNTSGSITQIDDPSQGIPQEFYWNEAQQLTGVKNQQGVHHYIYDHQGERIMKSSLITSTVYLNDQVIDDVNNLDPYTVYVNPFYVVTGFMGGDRVSKHYYMNQQRVATDISINYDPNGNGGAEAREASPRANAQNLALVDLSKVLRALDQPELDTTALTLPRIESVYPELQPSSTTSTALTENITNRILFWYHPDYLGNVDLVTEKDGYAYEFFVYTPWGEEMHQWNANTFNFSSPYRFNGKELDPETGLAYYGARYYQNKIGVWLSVDPMAHLRESLTPYNFVRNNPILRIDPTGALDGDYYDLDGNWLYNDGIDDGKVYEVSNHLPIPSELGGGEYKVQYVGQVENVKMTFSGSANSDNNKQADGKLNVIQVVSNGKEYTRASFSAVGGPWGEGSPENGNYTVDNLHDRGPNSNWSNPGMTVDGVGFSLNLNPQFETGRSLLRIHPDGGKYFGTQGCIGLTCGTNGLQEFRDLMQSTLSNQGNIPLNINILNNPNNNGYSRKVESNGE